MHQVESRFFVISTFMLKIIAQFMLNSILVSCN